LGSFFADQQSHGDRSGPGWYGRIGGACPVQGIGEVDGVPWYFRARGERWSLEFGVGELPDGELVGEAIFERGGYVGPWPDAGWIGVRHAWSLIARSIAEFRVWRAGEAK
jgi:hypothetical protein